MWYDPRHRSHTHLTGSLQIHGHMGAVNTNQQAVRHPKSCAGNIPRLMDLASHHVEPVQAACCPVHALRQAATRKFMPAALP